MKFTVSEVFCEVVSAFGFIAAFLPIAFFLNWASLDSVATWITSMTATKLLSFILVAYILGVFLNIIGLPADRFMPIVGITGQEPDLSSKRRFYQEASSDLFNFRTNTWNHYYCFRNLLTFSPVGLCLWVPTVFLHWGLWATAVFVVVFVVVVWILYWAVRDHANIYLQVTKTFDEE